MKNFKNSAKILFSMKNGYDKESLKTRSSRLAKGGKSGVY
jgi:hypothetical protein